MGYVVESLIFEAVNHPGKINFATDLLIQLPCNTRFSIPELCIGHLMSNDDIRDSVSLFIMTLCDKEPIFAELFIGHLMKLMTRSGDLLICCLKIITFMRQRANICRTVNWTPHDSLFVQIREILEQKLDRTIWD